jgi:hypothetical protein
MNRGTEERIANSPTDDAQLLALCAKNTKEGANFGIVEKAQSQ